MTTSQALDIGAAKQRLALALRPRIALIGLTSCALQFGGDAEDRIAVTDRIPHSDAAGPGAAAWSAATAALVTALDADPDLRALRQRLFDVGVASAFEGDQDDAGLWTSRRSAARARSSRRSKHSPPTTPGSHAPTATKCRRNSPSTCCATIIATGKRTAPSCPTSAKAPIPRPRNGTCSSAPDPNSPGDAPA